MTKVLVCRTGAFGDVCMALPIVHALTRHCEVHWLIGRIYAPLLQLFPQVRCRLVVVDRKQPAEDDRLVFELSAAGFDALLDLSNWNDIATLAMRLRSIPMRAIAYDSTRSYALQRMRNALPWFKPFNRVVKIDGCVHRTAKWQRLVEAALGYTLTIDWLLPAVLQRGPSVRVFVHPHASKASKRWPVERFVDVLSGLGRGTTLHCFVNEGQPAERPESVALSARLRDTGIGVTMVPFSSTFATLKAALGQVDFALGLDSGPMHLASLLGVPTIVVYGPYRPTEVAPLWRSVAIVPSSRRGTAIDIEPVEVSQAIHAFLSR